jgi:uncharacterized iron-regulated protein
MSNKINIYCRPLLALLMVILSGTLAAQQRPAFALYTSDGKPVTYQEMLVAARDAEVVLFGELHNNPISHWLQLELAIDLASDTTRTLAFGFEMFEADQQVLLDEYASGSISTTSFEREARLWPNYKTDYKPVLELGRTHGIRLVATNIPRRYASAVYARGLEALAELSPEAQQWMMPLPVEVDLNLPGYANIMQAAGGHGGVNLPYSQAIKDAAMAHFILENLVPGGQLLHLHGSYHTDNREGIIWYLQRARPDIRYISIATMEASVTLAPDPAAETIRTRNSRSRNASAEPVMMEVLPFPEDAAGRADFILVVNRNMTKTH